MSTASTQKKPAMTPETKPLFAVDYHVYINHTDAGGIVYHANHLVFFENCRRDWFTTLGLNTYFLQTDDGQIQHFVVNQVELQYRKAIFLDEKISVRIDKIELKPASIIFHQSIHRNFPANPSINSNLPDNMTHAKASLLSSAKIVIACVQNQAKGHESSSQSADKSAPSAPPIRPIRVPEQLQDIIKQAMMQQSVQSQAISN